MSGETLFDIEDFLPAYDGPVPLGFVREYFTPDELLDAARRRPREVSRHAWHSTAVPTMDSGPHGCVLVELVADLRCGCPGPRTTWRRPCPMHLHEQGYNDDAEQERCSCVGELVVMANCEPCRWHTIGSGAAVRFAWLDHAWPGWRDLPVIPAEFTPPYGGPIIPKNGSPNPEDVKAGKQGHAWAVEHYPPEWQVKGAPAVAWRRPEKAGLSIIGGYSPFGGFLIYKAPALESP